MSPCIPGHIYYRLFSEEADRFLYSSANVLTMKEGPETGSSDNNINKMIFLYLYDPLVNPFSSHAFELFALTGWFIYVQSMKLIFWI